VSIIDRAGAIEQTPANFEALVFTVKQNKPNPAKPEPIGEQDVATCRVEIIVENMFVVW
jgi:hypothetical protein